MVPGIGGFFRAIPLAALPRDSTFLFSPGTDQLGGILERKLGEHPGIPASVTKSLTELTTPVILLGYKALYDAMGLPVFTSVPVVVPSYGDVCLRFFVGGVRRGARSLWRPTSTRRAGWWTCGL
jgi:hypothetical protein